MFRHFFSRWLNLATRPATGVARHRGQKARRARTRFIPRLNVLEQRNVPSFVFQTIDAPNAGTVGNGTQGTFLIGINASGVISGNYGDANNVTHGFLLNHGQYTTLDDPSAGTAPFQGTNADGLNDRGQVVGLYWDANSVGHGFLLSHGTYTTLDDPNAVAYTVAVALNNEDQIVGYYSDSGSVIHGFLLSHGTYTTIDDPNAGTASGQGTSVIGINNDGQMSGNYIDAAGVYHGFVFSHGRFTTLDDPNAGTAPGQGTIAYGINDCGQIVGYYADATSIFHAFLFSHGQYTTLDDPNAATGADQGTIALGINDSGTIVGGWIDSANLVHGFVATPVRGHEGASMLVVGGEGQPMSSNAADVMSTSNTTAVATIALPPSVSQTGLSLDATTTLVTTGSYAAGHADDPFASVDELFAALVPDLWSEMWPQLSVAN